jgi:hypothetical protein
VLLAKGAARSGREHGAEGLLQVANCLPFFLRPKAAEPTEAAKVRVAHDDLRMAQVDILAQQKGADAAVADLVSEEHDAYVGPRQAHRTNT